MFKKIEKKINNNIKIYKQDLRTKGFFYTITDRFHKIPLLKHILVPLSDLFKPDFVIIDSQKVYVNKKDTTISPKLLSGEGWENFEREIFEKNLKVGDTVLDIGAHIGLYTLLAARIVGKTGKVYAFEPEPGNFSLLKKNVGENRLKNVILVKKAVSNKVGKVRLFIDDRNTGDNRIFDAGEGKRSLLVESISLDEFLGNSKRVNLIKMDIQGAEVQALEGALRILEKNPGMKIISEFWPKGLEEFGSGPREFLDLLEKEGFRMQKIEGDKRKLKKVSKDELLRFRHSGDKDYTNILCIR